MFSLAPQFAIPIKIKVRKTAKPIVFNPLVHH